jgi:hypothetical protein
VRQVDLERILSRDQRRCERRQRHDHDNRYAETRTIIVQEPATLPAI